MESSAKPGVSSLRTAPSDLPARGPDQLPDFFIIGAAKSGTTTLHNYLAQHPSLWMSAIKEPCYFDPNLPSEQRDPEKYRKLFEGANEEQYRGESSTNYTMWPQVPNVPRSISAVVPHARFIYLLREPIERCYSHFKHRHERERLPGQPYRMTFEEYLAFDPLIADASDYAAQIRQYLDYFPKSSLLLLPFERFVKEPAGVLQELFGFLGVEDISRELTDRPLHSNSSDKFDANLQRSRVLAPFRRVPGLRTLYQSLPKSIREKTASLAEKSVVGRRIQRQFTPPPILADTRERLRERFDASAKYLVEEFDFDLGYWTREPSI